MGNISSMARASTALDSYVAELGNDISYDKSLSSSRFLKTILARHASGPIVLKIFIKPDSTVSLRAIQRSLKNERDLLADLSSTNTYQVFVETDKAGYLIRQWIGSNLYDRISTQPYLANIEKRWIAFQLLTCLRDARARKVFHGDIKSENILITSDLSVLVTDFSSAFKPTHLPLDDPSDFSFFFDTSSRRTCYIAPERFFASDSPMAQRRREAAEAGDASNVSKYKRDGKVTEEMDVFSAGCVLAEMWTDGRTVFNLSELFAYREGSVGLENILDNIDDEHVKTMISQMLSREPGDRPSFDRVLSSFRETIFPEYFYTFLKDYASSLAELPENMDEEFLNRAAAQPGTRIDRMLDEWESIKVHLDPGDGENAVNDAGPALLLLDLVTSSIRNCLWPSSRLHGLKLFLYLSPYLSDEDKVDRIVPFTTELLSDETAIVRAEACRTLVLVVESVTSISLINAAFIPEYLLPQMRHLAVDPDIFVRATFAKSLTRLADAAVTMLEINQAERREQVAGSLEPDYDAMLAEIQAVVEEQATTLLVDAVPAVKRSILASIADLCLFFGRQKSSETVLSHIMTYLNDRDWHLRLAFFDGIVGVGAFIGIRAIEEYVLPLMIQALADPEEAVVARVITSLSSLAALGLLPRLRLWDVFFPIKGFLVHPNVWIRQGAAGFVAAAAKNLSTTDVWCILYPAVRPMLDCDILTMDDESIMSALIPPLPRPSLIAAKNAALHNSPAGFWDIPSQSSNVKTGLAKAVTASRRGDEPLQLKDKGISAKDERKIALLKEFIVKQAYAAKARSVTDNSNEQGGDVDLTSGKSVSLTDLGVTPQTVFISPRTVRVDARVDLLKLKPQLAEPGSRRGSVTSRSARGGTGTAENPLEEIRKRLASIEAMTPTSGATASETRHERTASDSALSTTMDLASVSLAGRKKGDSKAAPAIGASHTNAIGTTSIHDTLSGRSTPIPGQFGQLTPKATPYSSSYEGQDPGVRAFLEQVDLDNYRAPLLDFGPWVTAAHKKRQTRPKSSSPQNVTLIAHLTQHTGPITAIVTSPDMMFFATASEDSQVLIWDSARLERSVSGKARLTYRMDAPITCMCRIENSHCLPVAAEDGQVHVLRVHVAAGNPPKYSRIECIRSWATEAKDGHVTSVSHLKDSLLLIVTSASVVATLDIRSMDIVARFQHPLELGVITATNHSVHWAVVGTDAGSLSLWDLRFGLLLHSWRASGPILSIKNHPSRGGGRWIMVSTGRSAETPIIEVYDIETGKLVEIYEVRVTRPSPKYPPVVEGVTPPLSKNDYIEEIIQKQEAEVVEDDDEGTLSTTNAHPSVTCLEAGHTFASLAPRNEDGAILTSVPESKTLGSSSPGYIISAGEDRVIRYWDLNKASEGFVICGSPKEREVQFRHEAQSPPVSGRPAPPALYYTIPTPQRQTSEQRRAAQVSGRQPLRPHYDVICALGTVETSFSSAVISGDRSGVLKVWRLEGGPK